MVYAFFVGMFVGLPFGCYLSEVGYAKKFRNAYEIFVPPPEANKFDQYKNKSAEFYENIKRGQVDHKEFERYIYGGTKNLRSKDDIDEAEAKAQKAFQDFKKTI